jgi:hypothetical protein
MALIGHGVADFQLGSRFDVGDDIPDVTGAQTRLGKHFRREDAYFFHS